MIIKRHDSPSMECCSATIIYGNNDDNGNHQTKTTIIITIMEDDDNDTHPQAKITSTAHKTKASQVQLSTGHSPTSHPEPKPFPTTGSGMAAT